MDRCGELTGSILMLKIKRAHEERTRLNIEVQRLITAMRDEEADISQVLYIIWRDRRLACAELQDSWHDAWHEWTCTVHGLKLSIPEVLHWVS